MFRKIFGRIRKKALPHPEIIFGRYSDNNKSAYKVVRWTEAEKLFKENKIYESLDSFFDYLKDDTQDNVTHLRTGMEGRFEILQGSKIVRGEYNNGHLKAEVTLARMPRPSVPVMRRLLEMNFNLFYSRYAMDDQRLCMRFDTGLNSATPNKLYYGLKELATKADKQDDLLVQNFSSLEKADIDHIIPISEGEKQIKYDYFHKWTNETLEYITTLDQDKFSGAIAYLLLTLAYRIDYLICPEGPTMNELETIPDVYFKKDTRPVAEKNISMVESFQKLKAKNREEIYPFLFRSKHTFSIVSPQNYKTIADAIKGSHDNMYWYRDNNYHMIANKVLEYGLCFCQFSYSVPKPFTQLFQLFMEINYPDFFKALGFSEQFYDLNKKTFFRETLIDEIQRIIEQWISKYPKLEFKTGNLRFDSILNFNFSFSKEMMYLKFE